VDSDRTRKMVYAAFLIALSIVFTRVLSIRIPFMGVEGIRIGFGGLPIVFAGIALGPVAGAVVGGLADLIGYFINPMGPFMPHFTLTSLLTGLIPGLMVCYLFRGKKTFTTLLITIGVTQLITAIVMVPYFMQTLFGVPYAVSLPPRLISQAFMIPIYAYLSQVLLGYDLIKSTEFCAPARQNK